MIIKLVVAEGVLPFYFNYTAKQDNYAVTETNKPVLQECGVNIWKLLNKITLENASFLITF